MIHLVVTLCIASMLRQLICRNYKRQLPKQYYLFSVRYPPNSPLCNYFKLIKLLQMKIVFNTFKSVSPKIFDLNEHLWKVGEDNSQNYAYHILTPLYKVCEGFAGKVISGKFSVCNLYHPFYYSFLPFLLHDKRAI